MSLSSESSKEADGALTVSTNEDYSECAYCDQTFPTDRIEENGATKHARYPWLSKFWLSILFKTLHFQNHFPN